MTEFPYVFNPQDAAKLLKMLPDTKVPSGKVSTGYFKSLGFSVASAKYLLDMMKKLSFINEKGEASETWKRYVVDESGGLILAAAIRNAYSELFDLVFCPYLEGDDSILDFFKQRIKASPAKLELMIKTFRSLCESADFQEIMCRPGDDQKSAVSLEKDTGLSVKVNPHLQVNVQIHIDPNTPDEKIEVIFKNMRKYLLEKEI